LELYATEYVFMCFALVLQQTDIISLNIIKYGSGNYWEIFSAKIMNSISIRTLLFWVIT